MNLQQLVIDAAAKHPDRLAVADAGSALSYAELNRRADALAARLRSLGVQRGDRVIIWSDKSVAAITAMQAVLRLGAAYVPVDGSSPVRRAGLLAQDCAARAVVAPLARIPAISAELGSSFLYQDIDGHLDAESALDGQRESINETVDENDLAYILYTSGSTGTPKGVCISHLNAWAFVDWAATELAARPEDRFANHAPLTFDLSVLDLYAAFAAAASVHLVPAELAYAPAQLVDFVHERQITIWYSVPSALSLMIREGALLDRPAPSALRAVLFAGEPFAIGHVRELAGWTSARLLNLYGPTETNVCTFHEVTAADLERDRPVPIGGPASGDTVWAQHPDGAVCAEGEEGELFVDGPTVMLGYWGGAPVRPPYGTGDIVKVLPGGRFDYAGRRDHMVKVRGHRVELGEVEAAIASHPDIADAAAIVVGSGIDARLVAFAVPHPGREPGALALRGHCAQRLPRYLVADSVHFVPRLPRTGNGKVDRAALTTIAQAPDRSPAAPRSFEAQAEK